ncbi:MAG: hypothetical protein QNK05_05080 [Myxococcota bacterium]|nr:hypothetical protein [Myxococcota bacterium]
MRVSALSTILALSLLAIGCGADEPGAYETGLQDYTQDGRMGAPGAYAQTPPPQQSQSGVVTLYDHGMQMARGQITVPSGWRVNQDIATDPNTGRFMRFVYDIVGPNGELVRNLPIYTYQSMMGQQFEPMWRDAVMRALHGALEGVQIGALQTSAVMQRVPTVQQAMQAQNAQPLEAPLQASRGGQPYAGRVYVVNMPFPADPSSGVFVPGLIVAPPDRLEAAIQANLQMALSARPNPQFEQAYAAIDRRVRQQMQRDHQQRMARNQAAFDAHQRRMAGNQAAFDAHQQRMAGNQAAFDAQNRQWLENFRGSGGSGASPGGGYTTNDQFNDYIRDTDTFYDPDSGQNVQLDGYYDRTFTDGLGNFYRTDDPSFDPNSMQGNWNEVQPLQPQ